MAPQWKEQRIERRALQWQEPRRESELSRRVKQCLEENCKEEKVVDIERLTLRLCTTYPKYGRRNQAIFKAQVARITLMLEKIINALEFAEIQQFMVHNELDAVKIGLISVTIVR